MAVSVWNFLNWLRPTYRESIRAAENRHHPSVQIVGMGAPFEVAQKFNPAFSVLWAHGLYEIFFPIDTCADKACNVPYIKVNDKGEVLEYTAAEKVFMRRPTPITSFTQLLYNYAFNLLASGNAYIHYLQTGDIPSYANVLNTDLVILNYNGENGGVMLSKDNNITNYTYGNYDIDKNNIYYSCYLPETFDNEMKRGLSPLSIVTKNINLLLSVYTARFNIYQNNGLAGIITKKATNENQFEIALDPVTQKTISDELLQEYNISRLNNIKAISSIPLDFVKTLATIQELEPFREVQADAIAIAAVYGVKRELLGRETDTTFNNQRDAERFLWQNTIKSLCFDIAEMLQVIMNVKQGEYIIPDLTQVEVLQDDELTRTQILEKKINILQNLSQNGTDYSEKINTFAQNL